MSDSTAAKIVWREWASCDFRDDDYLLYLFGLVRGRPGGAWGAVVLGAVATLWAPLALGPLCLFASWMVGLRQGYGAEWIFANTAMLLAYVTPTVAGLSLIAGYCMPWRWLFILLTMSLPSAFGAYIVVIGAIVEAFFVGPAPLILGLVIALVIAAIVGKTIVFCVFVLIAGAISICPFIVAVVIAQQWREKSALLLRRFCIWWRGRPHYLELEQALAALDKEENPSQRGTSNTPSTEERLSSAIEKLSFACWRTRFQARHTCIRMGGLTIRQWIGPTHKVNAYFGRDQVRTSLVRSITSDTTTRLRSGTFLCPACHARVRQQVALQWTYYGCRQCGRSHDVMRVLGRVVCVLDEEPGGPTHRLGPDVHIPWTPAEPLSDFDRVEIVAATDEQVERLVMSMANDTDPFRRRVHAWATCGLSSTCRLTTNTMRLLAKTFGHVETLPARSTSIRTPLAIHESRKGDESWAD